MVSPVNTALAFAGTPTGGVLLGLVALVTWFAWYPHTRWRMRNIPGPVGLPLVGNLLDIVRLDSPKYFKQAAAKYGPVTKVWFGARPWVIVSDPDAGRRLAFKLTSRGDVGVVLNSLTGEERIVDTLNLFSVAGPIWRLARRAFEAALINPARLADHAPHMESCTGLFVQRLRQLAATGEAVDMSKQFGDLSLAVVGEAAYGVNFGTLQDTAAVNSQDFGQKLMAACKHIFQMTHPDRGGLYLPLQQMFPEAVPLIRTLASYFPDPMLSQHLVARKTVNGLSRQLMAMWQADKEQSANGAAKTANGPTAHSSPGSGTRIRDSSFLAALLEGRRGEVQESERLSENAVIAQSLAFILAGYETTAGALATTVYMLATNPEAEAKLLQEVSAVKLDADIGLGEQGQFPYAEACIKESLRLVPPGPWLMRGMTSEPVEVLGHVIPGGVTVMIPTYTFHTSPEYWQQPEKYMPERFMPGGEVLGPHNPHAYAPFGIGARACPGYKFANLEAKIALVRLYQHFTFKLHPRQKVPLPTKTGLVHGADGGVWVTVHVR